jgi:5-(aminomethyl)-3-furanmethanol phosphate kinase
MSAGPTVVKVGGSLFDLPGLGERLALWLKALGRREVILTAGGGNAAEMVRDMDRIHGLGEKRSHSLALRSLTFTAHLLVELLPPSRFTVVEHLTQCQECWQQDGVPVLDLGTLAREDDAGPERLPHSWMVTSDSVAAWVAMLAQAHELVLLKSITIPAEMSWDEASRLGFVDEHFPNVAQGLRIRVVNLRTWSP